jgi:hypothetical protein
MKRITVALLGTALLVAACGSGNDARSDYEQRVEERRHDYWRAFDNLIVEGCLAIKARVPDDDCRSVRTLVMPTHAPYEEPLCLSLFENEDAAVSLLQAHYEREYLTFQNSSNRRVLERLEEDPIRGVLTVDDYIKWESSRDGVSFEELKRRFYSFGEESSYETLHLAVVYLCPEFTTTLGSLVRHDPDENVR